MQPTFPVMTVVSHEGTALVPRTLMRQEIIRGTPAMKKLMLAGLSAAAWSSCALAADLGPYTPPPPAEPYYEPARDRPFSWQGLYFGANGGYGWNADSSASFAGGSGSISPDGWFAGAQIGYNAQFRALVLGIEADFQGADIANSNAFATNVGLTTTSSEVDWFSTVRGRIGYAAGPALLYVTGGWAFGEVDYRLNSPAASFSGSETQNGYTLGGGVEWAFAPNWSLKTEYLYVDLGKETFNGPVGPYTTETDFHTARVGLNYRF